MKRLVLAHTEGPLAGIKQIYGLLEGEVPNILVGPYSVEMPVGPKRTINLATLTRKGETYALYTESKNEIPDELYEFDPEECGTNAQEDV